MVFQDYALFPHLSVARNIAFGLDRLVMLLGGFDNPWTWVIGILYFLLVHAGLILLGVMGLSRAINGRSWRYPVFGPREPV